MVALLLAASLLTSGDFVPYTESFVRDSGGVIKHEDLVGSIVFKEQEYSEKDFGVIGLCYQSIPYVTDGFRIEIDPLWWARASDSDRWQLMYHELGHCLCNLEHTPYPAGKGFIGFLKRNGVITDRNLTFPGGCDRTIMYKYNTPGRCIDIYREAYIEDIFSRCETR